MNDTVAIEALLRAQLPAHLYDAAAPLAAVLQALHAGQLQPAQAQVRLAATLSGVSDQAPSGDAAAAEQVSIRVDASGDQITVGDIQESPGVAVGDQANAQVAQGSNILQVAQGGIGLVVHLAPAQGQVRRAPFMAPDLPADFVPRPDEFERIALNILSASSSPVAISTALRGAGGYGKTTLAMAVCHDQRVRQAFPDGVLWVTLGERPSEADLVGRAVDLIEQLTGSRPGYTSLEAATSALAETFGGRRLLLVVDDVWDATHLRPFLQGGTQVTRLITTRNRDTLPPDVRPVDVDAMRQGEAVELLAAGLSDARQADSALRALAGYLGEWPLLLKIINGVLRERVDAGVTLEDALAYVHEGLHEEGIVAFDTESAEGRTRAVRRTLSVSLTTLTAEEQQRFAELAIFPEDVAIPLVTLQHYWSLSTFKVKRLCGLLFARSLLLAYDEHLGTVRLHDVVRAYLCRAYQSELSAFHNILLNAHRPSTGQWAHMAEDDPYLWRYLATHLVEASCSNELAVTAKDLHYLAQKAVLVDVTAVEGDVRRAVALNASDEVLPVLVEQLQQHSHLLARCRTTRDAVTLLLSLCWQQPLVHKLCLPNQVLRTQSLPLLVPLHALPRYSSGARRRTLQGHTDIVWRGVFSPDGRLVLSASLDGGLILWEVATGQRRHTFERHTDAVISGVFSPDGQLVLSASNSSLILWEVATGQRRHTLEGHTDAVTSGVFSPDGQLVLSSSLDGNLMLWEVATGQRRQIFEGHTDRVWSGVFNPDGQLVLSSSEDNRLILWEVATGHCRHILEGHTDAVTSGVFSPDGQLVLSCSADRSLILWEVALGRPRHILQGHSSGVTSGVFSPDGQLVLSASIDDNLILWDVITGQRRQCLQGHTDTVWSGVFSPDGQLVLSASEDKNLILWDVITGQRRQCLQGHTDTVWSGVFSPDGQLVLSVSKDKNLILWEVAKEQTHHTLQGHSSRITSAVFSPDGQFALSASEDGKLILWDVALGQPRHTLQGHSSDVMSGVFSPDGQFVLSASKDRKLLLWNTTTGQLCHTLQRHSGTVICGVFSPDGQLVLSASNDSRLFLWDVTTGTPRHSLQKHTRDVWSGVFSPDGQFVLSASSDSSLILWKATTGEVYHILKGHTSDVISGVFSPDGKLVLSASLDGRLILWEVTTGQMRCTLQGHTKDVTGGVFSSDGQFVLSASKDQRLMLWDVATGQVRHTLQGHTGPVSSGAFSPDGRLVLSASEDASLILWEVATGLRLSTLYLDYAVACCTFSPDGRMLVAGDSVGRVLFLRVLTPDTVSP